jgi:cytochrome c oxidase accessory protein FixG
MNFLRKREMGFLVVTLIGIILPFITINGNHLWLLDFIHQEFHLVGQVFTVQQLHLMPFMIMLLFIGLFAVTSVVGRVWCGWACPQTIFRFIYRDLIQTYLLSLRGKIDNKQKQPDMSKTSNQIKYIISVILFMSLAFVVSANFMLYFIPYDYFFAHLLDFEDYSTMNTFWLGISMIIVLLVVVFKEGFCIYACPYARVQSVLYDKHTYTPVYSNNRGGVIYSQDGVKQVNSKKDLSENDECIACEKCVKICPTGIDIRKGMQIECIGCFGCIDACT